jgi:hypothetical protein
MLKTAAVGLSLLCGIALSLFVHREMSGESWTYWLFARIFAEQGRFIIPDRSPLYVLYVSAFRWLGYPNAITAEYVVTSLLVLSALATLFKRYLGVGLAAAAALLWLPYLQIAEPAVQGLALACSCLAMVARRGAGGRLRGVVSYALLVLAYLFRPSYLVLLVVFAVWDLAQAVKRGGLKTAGAVLRPRPMDWPILILLGFFVWVSARQSDHPWNNAYVATATWFPSRARSLGDSHLIQAYNMIYLRDHYGTYAGRDFYFTNRELFHGAEDAWGALRANPRFIVEQTVKNLRTAIGIVPYVTTLPDFSRVRLLGGLANLFLIAVILFGALRGAGDEAMVVFVLAHILLLASTVLILPEVGRYYVPAIPLLVLSASWYGAQACRLLAHGSRAIPGSQMERTGHWLVMLAVLILCSNGPRRWAERARSLIGDIRTGDLHVLEGRPLSMKASFSTLEPLVQSCKGVLSLEHTFVGAFMDVPLERVHDVWELPPFGRFGQRADSGLRPEHIDCVLVSDELATGVGKATNYQLRYQSYLKPYTDYLVSLGADTHEVPGFGRAVILGDRRPTSTAQHAGES